MTRRKMVSRLRVTFGGFGKVKKVFENILVIKSFEEAVSCRKNLMEIEKFLKNAFRVT